MCECCGNNEHLHSVELNVKGMTCSGCSGSIEKAVGSTKGVKSVSADFNSGKVNVQFNPNDISVDHIKKSIVNAGYEVE